MSEQPSGTTEPLSISELDLSDPILLSSSVNKVYKDLLEILISLAGNASETTVESTHQTRKKLKFFRAFVKLLKPFHSTEKLKQVNIQLRDFGRHFSDLRDAHVRDLMIEEFRNEPSFSQSLLELQSFDKQNKNEIIQIESGLFEPQNRFLHFAKELEQSKLLKNYMNISNPEPEVVLDSLRDSFQKSAIAYQIAFESNDPGQMHEWRKRLKDVQYQFELILKSLSKPLHESYNSVDELCDHLGRYNDLDMFYQWLAQIDNQTEISVDTYTGRRVKDQIDELYPLIKRLGLQLYKKSPFVT